MFVQFKEETIAMNRDWDCRLLHIHVVSHFFYNV